MLRAVIVLVLGATPALASPPIPRQPPWLRALDAMMAALAPERQAVGAPPTGRSAHVVAFSGRDMRRQLTPTVTTEVLALVQADGSQQTLWTDADGPLDAPSIETSPVPAELSPGGGVTPAFGRWFVLLFGVAATTWRIASPRRHHILARLFP